MTSSQKWWPLFILAALAVWGCATSYRPMGFSGGYAEQRLVQDSYLVWGCGDALLPQEKAEIYLQFIP